MGAERVGVGEAHRAMQQQARTGAPSGGDRGLGLSVQGEDEPRTPAGQLVQPRRSSQVIIGRCEVASEQFGLAEHQRRDRLDRLWCPPNCSRCSVMTEHRTPALCREDLAGPSMSRCTVGRKCANDFPWYL
jgi:hypothetical protein